MTTTMVPLMATTLLTVVASQVPKLGGGLVTSSPLCRSTWPS
jgi:hypothetical protein